MNASPLFDVIMTGAVYCRTQHAATDFTHRLYTALKNFQIPPFDPLNAELNPICHLVALLGAHHILHISRIRVKGHYNPLNAELNPICHLVALLGAHHILHVSSIRVKGHYKPLNAELNPICHLLALLGAHHILHFSRIRVKSSVCSSYKVPAFNEAQRHGDVLKSGGPVPHILSLAT